MEIKCGLLLSKRREEVLQLLWSYLPFHLQIEILRHFDVGNYQRFKRVCRGWSLNTSYIIRANSGAVYVTLKHKQWPKTWCRREWEDWITANIGFLSWSNFLGCDVAKVRQIICDEEMPFGVWAKANLVLEPYPTLTFSAFPHRLDQVTVLDSRFHSHRDLFDCKSAGPRTWFERMESGRTNIESILAKKVEKIVFIDMRIIVRGALNDLWLMWWDVPGIEGNDFRWTVNNGERMWDVPYYTEHVIPQIVFDQHIFDKYCYGPKRCFLYLPWLCDVLAVNDVLWKYPPEQTEWLQQCMDMLPPTPNLPSITEDAMDYWTRDAVRKRFKYRKIWREQFHLPVNVFPLTTVHFEEYYLDTFDCEIFANWFLMTKNWFSRFNYYKGDEQHCGSIQFARVHPSYPCMPCSMVGPKPKFEIGTELDFFNHAKYVHFWKCTKRAEKHFHPRPFWKDLVSAYRLNNPRVASYIWHKKMLWKEGRWRRGAIFRWLGVRQPESISELEASLFAQFM